MPQKTTQAYAHQSGAASNQATPIVSSQLLCHRKQRVNAASCTHRSGTPNCIKPRRRLQLCRSRYATENNAASCTHRSGTPNCIKPCRRLQSHQTGTASNQAALTVPEKTTQAIRTKMELHQSNTHQSGTTSNQAAPTVPQKTTQAIRTKMELHQRLPCSPTVTREKTTTQFSEGGSIGQRSNRCSSTQYCRKPFSRGYLLRRLSRCSIDQCRVGGRQSSCRGLSKL